MKFAAIADIHGNAPALEAVLADIAARSITDIVNLGDSLSGPLEAGRTADLLIGLDFPTVRGNHDRYFIEPPPGGLGTWECDVVDQLTPAHYDWIRSLPPTLVWRDDVYLCHATPTHDNAYWMEEISAEGIVHLRPQAEIEAIAEGISQSLILCGHSHLPRALALSGGRMIVNPGSVGCPAYHDDRIDPYKVETGTPRASYAILETTPSGWDVTFRLVDYDHHAMARMAGDMGHHDWVSALATGRINL